MSEEIKGIDRFDWVTERAKCSLKNVFENLKLEVREQVNTRQNLRTEQAHYGFQFASKGPSFVVFLQSNKINKSVTFLLTDSHIEVQNQDAKMFEATVGLDDEGECVLRVNGRDRKLWQVTKLALEHLFFEAI